MKCFFLFVFVLIYSVANAGVGCVSNKAAYSSKIYLEKNNGGKYKHNGIEDTLEPGCFWMPTGVGSCEITGSAGPSGYLAYDSPQNCDIDSNILFLILGSLGLGIFVIRKKTLMTLSSEQYH